MPDLAALNALDDSAAAAELTRCCGARRWVDEMLAARPFRTESELFEAATRVWESLAPEDWLQAFAHHPRIGDATAARAQTQQWSRQEQAGMDAASESVRIELARGNVEYEQRFGFIFLIAASGKSASEMLAALQERLTHDRDTEVRVAAREHARITRLRLEKLLLG